MNDGDGNPEGTGFRIRRAQRARGQLAIEYLLVTGFQLALITILAGYGFLLYFETVKNAQTISAVNSLVDGVNRTYSLGPGNAMVVEINLPDGTTASSVGIAYPSVFDFTISGISVQGITDAPLSGTLPSSPGLYLIRIENRDTNVFLSVV